jgi:hypothetical protein
VIRLLLLLVGTISAAKHEQRNAGRYQAQDFDDTTVLDPDPAEPTAGETRPTQPRPAQRRSLPPAGPRRGNPASMDAWFAPRRRRVPRWVKWAVGLTVVGLIFRRAIASLVLLALSAALHLIGVNAHLPSIKFGWPWQSITAGTKTNTDLGPWVLQKIEGISRPALGQANFNFYFTHKVSKSIGPWPCWYSSTFYAVGHASATVDLNPGTAWWGPTTGHYKLQVLSRPHSGKPGHVTVTMVLPRPQLPQSAHQVTIDNLPSKPIDSQHSWTYPGLGCGVLLKPQFAESVLYAQAQTIAFYKATHSPQVTGPLIRTAEAEATQTIRDNFVQPTVNAFGYMLDGLNIRWANAP